MRTLDGKKERKKEVFFVPIVNLCNKYNKNVFNAFISNCKNVFYSLDKIRIRNICVVSQNC